MTNDNIEDLILSGKFFSTSRSSSPARSPSPGWHDDELLSGSEDEGAKLYQHQQPRGAPQHESVGMGPGRTGVKGVIRDRNEAQSSARDRRTIELAELNKKMEKASLGGKTFLEEEREREIEQVLREGPSRDENANVDRISGKQKDGRFGHLREVGVHGFVDAVEREERNTWVVVHLYEPVRAHLAFFTYHSTLNYWRIQSVDRCYLLDDTLAKLARLYPTTKFLRCRAAMLGFAATKPVPVKSTPGRAPPRTIIEDDEDDPYGDGDYDGDDAREDLEYDEEAVDTDMLPTLLVYHHGELVYNWVRVDWEAGEAGVEELLAKHRVLPRAFTLDGSSDLSDDDDLLKKISSRTVIVRLVSTAQSGYFYTTQRPRLGPKLSFVKYDPKVKQRVLFVESKKTKK
ncbi:hypothetical protein HWV62_34639 [Athelia sp. TMB]|nr:hypothetical protein HWV62_34639 [Athelia sp. TMB]